ncbi:hypothetical protein F4779DRAFT_581018 [Xylariaceae sp. FL0662B]|nr:hypothetical protein F4779DRAFT_581018 [Xylariaceae sp. FL0662B]
MEPGITAWAADQDTAKPLFPSRHDSVLLHIFGEAAATSASAMLSSYHARTGKALNIEAVVFDTAPMPTKYDLVNTIRQPDCLFTSMYYQMMPHMDWARIWSYEYRGDTEQALYDGHLIPSSAQRCYVCPATDVMLSWREGTADSTSQRQEFHVKRQAVDHPRWNSHRERYWTGIECAWNGKDN